MGPGPRTKKGDLRFVDQLAQLLARLLTLGLGFFWSFSALSVTEALHQPENCRLRLRSDPRDSAEHGVIELEELPQKENG